MTPMTLKLAAAGIALTLAAAGGFGAAWRWRTNDITQLELNHANARIATQRAARVEAERRVATQRAADLQAQSSLRTVVVDSERVASVGSGLRLTTQAMRTSSQDTAACPANAAALADVFDDCQAAYGAMAETADRWVIDAVKQHEAAQ